MLKHIHKVRYGNSERISFSKIKEPLDIPYLIEVQKESYEYFINEGIREVFEDFSPITDFSGHFELYFLDHSLEGEPKFPEKECKNRDATFAKSLKVKVRLVNKDTGEVMDQDVFMGEFPLMTENGSFIINGAERVVVSQLVRSPGVYNGKTVDNRTGKDLVETTVIPNRGAWLEFEQDGNDILWVHVDRTRKLTGTVLLRALGFGTDQQLLELFDNDSRIKASCEKDTAKSETDGLIELYKRLRPGEVPTQDSVRSQLYNLFFDAKRYDLAKVGRYKFNKKLSIADRIAGHKAYEDISAAGKTLVKKGEIISEEVAYEIQNSGINVVYLAVAGGEKFKVIGNNTVNFDIATGLDHREFKLTEYVYWPELKKLIEQAKGKEELAELVKKSVDKIMPKHITIDDIISTVSYNLGLRYAIGSLDNIDHLGNRRVRSVGELLQNQFRIGIARLERVIKERMATQDPNEVTPQSLINIRPVTSAIKEFFGSSQLSQFMDQSNPIAELTHKRKLSALGPGGLNRDRATFDVRDVNHSHYGRMCPIETPE